MLLLSLSPIKLSLFDKSVILALFVMAFATAFMVWRGDQVGVEVVSVSPVAGTIGVSTKTDIQVTFDQVMAGTDADVPLTLSPPISGTVAWEGPTLTFSPNLPLAPNTTYTVRLTTKLAGQSGRTLLDLPSWQFQTRQAQACLCCSR